MCVAEFIDFKRTENGAVSGREVRGKGVHFILHFLAQYINETRNRRR